MAVITCARTSSLISLILEAITSFDNETSLSFLAAASPRSTCDIFSATSLIQLFSTGVWSLFSCNQDKQLDMMLSKLFFLCFTNPKSFPVIKTCWVPFHFLFCSHSSMHVIEVRWQLIWPQTFICKNGITTHALAFNYTFLYSFCETVFYELDSPASLSLCRPVGTLQKKKLKTIGL